MQCLLLALLWRLAVASSASCTPKYNNIALNEVVYAPDLFTVEMEMVNGNAPIIIEVNRSWAPNSADHFYAMLRERYLDCAAWHRIDFASDTTVASVLMGIAADPDRTEKWDFHFDSETNKVIKRPSEQYTLSFVPYNGKGTCSTYIMINLEDNSERINGWYYPFARVVGGFDVLAEFSDKPFPPNGTDIAPDYITGGNDWLFSEYSDNEVSVMRSVRSESTSSSGGGGDDSGTWAFGVIVVFISSAACVYALVYLYGFIRRQQGYDSMSPESESGSTDRIIQLNNVSEKDV